MGGGKGGSAPAAPNYSQLLSQQGQLNQSAFNQQIGSGRVNQSNPYGYSQWTPPPGVYSGASAGSSSPAHTTGPQGPQPNPNVIPGPNTTPNYNPRQPAIMAQTTGYRGSTIGPGLGANTPATPSGPGYDSSGNYVGVNPAAPWTQNTGFMGPMSNIVNQSQANATSALDAFNVGNNPTWQGPNASQASSQTYQGPTAADAAAMQYLGPNPNSAASLQYGGPDAASATQNLQFNPANVAQSLYGQQMGLLEPGMQQQSTALDNNLKAMGYDTTQAGGAQNAENNLQNQQNLVRTQAANAAVGQAIPQGAQALAAQESIPALQAQLGNTQFQNQLSGLMGAGQLAGQQFGAGAQQLGLGGQLAGQQLQGNLGALQAGAGIAGQQFGAGQAGQQLLGSQASGFLNNAMSPSSLLPGGAAQSPTLNPVDAMSSAQQGYANSMSGYNAQQAAAQSQQNGLMGLASSGILAYAMSDRRLKTNIEKLNEVWPGMYLYKFNYKSDPATSHLGYMSDEVRRVRPEAVAVNAQGFDMVNYSLLPSVGAA